MDQLSQMELMIVDFLKANASGANIGIADYVVEQGHIRGGWYYRKWNSGKAECFNEGTNYAPSGTATAVGNLYRAEIEVYLPDIFIVNPIYIYVSPLDPSTDNIISMNGCAIDSETIKFYVWTTTRGNMYVYASCHIIGNWK